MRNQITVAAGMIQTLWMIIISRQILHKLEYINKLQCYVIIIIDITIHDHKYAMMTSCLCLSLYCEYHVEILAIVMYTRVCTVCVSVHMCVLYVCV